MKINSSTFSSKLDKEFQNVSNLITEDLIRHWFIKDQKFNVGNVEIEKQYNLLNKKANNITISDHSRIDLFYNSDNTAIEFKFHRKTKNSDNCSATKAGSLFRDFNRLSLLDYEDKYVVYVLDNQMLKYYKNNQAYQQVVSNLINKKTVSNLDFHNMNICREFSKVAFSSFSAKIFSQFNYNVKIEYEMQLDGGNYHLIIFRIF